MVGENLKKIMADRKISAKQLAEKVEVSPTHLSYVMNGKRNLSFELAQKIAYELNVSLSDIFQDKDGINSQEDGVAASFDYQFPNVVKILRRDGKKITPEKERLIARIIETAIKDE